MKKFIDEIESNELSLDDSKLIRTRKAFKTAYWQIGYREY